jgi:hypothetical protein
LVFIFSGAYELLPNNHYSGGAGPVWLDGLGCNENATGLQGCQLIYPWGDISYGCNHLDDMSVVCNEGSLESGTNGGKHSFPFYNQLLFASSSEFLCQFNELYTQRVKSLSLTYLYANVNRKVCLVL